MLGRLIRIIYADHDSPAGSLEQNTWMGSEPERIFTALPYITRHSYYYLSKALLLFKASGIALGGLGNECLALLSSQHKDVRRGLKVNGDMPGFLSTSMIFKVLFAGPGENL